MRAPRHWHGFTLVDVLLACAVAATLAGVALPSYRDQIVRARRADATAALQRLQAAQERLRSTAGTYSADFAALRLAPTSEQGHFTLVVELAGPEAYRARALPAQPDPQCPELWVDVNLGFAQPGPSARCWNR